MTRFAGDRCQLCTFLCVCVTRTVRAAPDCQASKKPVHFMPKPKPAHGKQQRRPQSLGLAKFADAKTSTYDKQARRQKEQALNSKVVNKYRKLRARLEQQDGGAAPQAAQATPQQVQADRPLRSLHPVLDTCIVLKQTLGLFSAFVASGLHTDADSLLHAQSPAEDAPAVSPTQNERNAGVPCCAKCLPHLML